MRRTISVIVLTLLPASWALALTTTTVSFQNGVDGYSGTYDRYIAQIPDQGVDGSVLNNVGLIGNTQQGLFRFDDIFGNGPGQIPYGARIIDASLQLSTRGGPDADGSGTNGPFTVSGLTSPFDSSTVYSTYSGGFGAWFGESHTTRPQGSYGRLDGGETQAANVRSIVQQWSDQTLANNGLAVNGGVPTGTDEWRILTTGNPSAGSRPKLSVTYTMDNVAVNTFQRGTNGYTNVESARVTSLCNTDGNNCTAANPAANFVTTNGNNIGSMTLQLADASSNEQFALFRFNDMFGSNVGQAPADKPVAKAFLVLTTLDGTSAPNGRIPAPVDAYEMNTGWTLATTFDQFGANIGLQSGDGDIMQETLYRTPSASNSSEVWFDVTGYAENIRNGAANNGIAIQARSTDGWQFRMNGSSAALIPERPRLVIMSDLSAVGGSLPGDFNNDTKVDAADYVYLRKTNAPAADFTTWRANFGNSGSGPAAPQSTTVLKYDGSPKNGVLTGAINNGTTALVTLPAAPAPTGVTGIEMSRGSGLNGAGLTNGYSSSGWTSTDLASAVAANDYHEFGFTLDATHTASLSKLDMTMRRGDANAPTTFEVHASFDNFVSSDIVVPFDPSQTFFTYMGRANGDAPDPDPSLDTPFYYMTNDQPGRPNTTFSSTDPIPTIDLSTIAALQNIAPGTTVKFRMYGWGGTTEGATFGFRVTGPLITGIVSSVPGFGTANVPEPSSILLVSMGAVLFIMRRGQRTGN